jgi:hypothetical protein
MGAFFGCLMIAIMLGLILDVLSAINITLKMKREDVDSERCKCQICDGQVPTMRERK